MPCDKLFRYYTFSASKSGRQIPGQVKRGSRFPKAFSPFPLIDSVNHGGHRPNLSHPAKPAPFVLAEKPGSGAGGKGRGEEFGAGNFQKG